MSFEGPAYNIDSAALRTLRAKANALGSVKALSPADQIAYSKALASAIRSKNKSEARRGLYETARCPCASGSWANTYEGIHNAVIARQRRELDGALKADHDRKLSDGWFEKEYARLMEEKRARIAAEAEAARIAAEAAELEASKPRLVWDRDAATAAEPLEQPAPVAATIEPAPVEIAAKEPPKRAPRARKAAAREWRPFEPAAPRFKPAGNALIARPRQIYQMG